MKDIFIAFLGFVLLISCDDSGTKPPSTGKSGELLIIIEDSLWKGITGKSIRDVFAKEQPGLPQAEPCFDLIHISENKFSSILKKHHALLVITTDNNISAKPVFSKKENLWATPQLMLKINAAHDAGLSDIISQNGTVCLDIFNDFENKRIVSGYEKIKNRILQESIEEKYHISMLIPQGFYMAKQESDFLWIRRETAETSQGFLIYKRPYTELQQFSKKSILSFRDSSAKHYVPGPSEGTFMTTSYDYPVSEKSISFNKEYAQELRGLWKIQGDFMGGPFVSYTLLDKKKKEIITLEGYVYAPKFEKREYLRQMESILKTAVLN